MSTEAARNELRWCLLGPVLWPESTLPELVLPHTIAAWVERADLTDWPVLPRRLGLRFETIWAWALDRLPGWKVLASEVQVAGSKGTLGALDLLADSPDGVLHIELATKFYLCRRHRDGASPAHFVGPNRRDRLDKKLQRMHTHQLPMGARPETRLALKKRGIPAPTRSVAVLRGVCFSDWRQPNTAGPGRWCTRSELPHALPEARVLDRTHWLGGHGALAVLREDALLEAVDAQLVRGAVQLLDAGGRRWMVVDDDWTQPHDTAPRDDHLAAGVGPSRSWSSRRSHPTGRLQGCGPPPPAPQAPPPEGGGH